jgi:hypothetical protein
MFIRHWCLPQKPKGEMWNLTRRNRGGATVSTFEEDDATFRQRVSAFQPCSVVQVTRVFLAKLYNFKLTSRVLRVLCRENGFPSL